MPAKPASKPRRSSSQASRTDWERLDALRDEDLDTADLPEPSPEQFARAVLRKGLEPIYRDAHRPDR